MLLATGKAVVMDPVREMEEFRRIRIVTKVERAEYLITTYREHIMFFRDQLNTYHNLLGRIGERLGEPEPEEPS
jgi:hypothetical protein